MPEQEFDVESVMKPKEISWYGWRPSMPDHRDLRYAQVHALSYTLPESVDLRSKDVPIWDQGNIGSCTAHAAGGMAAFVRKKLGLKYHVPSRLFIYYNSRLLEGTVWEDSGCTMRSAMRTIVNVGLPHENLWWYNTEKFMVKPNRSVYIDGSQHTAKKYMRLNQDLSELRSCLADGFPFIFGFMVYPGFESEAVAKSGNLALPGPNEAPLGGHAVMCVGYNDVTRRFIVRNSWGTDWGTKGYFTMPYDYVLNENHASDFWTLRTAS